MPGKFGCDTVVSMKKIISHVVIEQENGWRLERVLKSRLEMSPQEISRAKFRPDGICVNGIRRKVTEVVQPGDRVEVCLEEEALASDQLISMPGQLDILYEDEDVLVVNKPAGLVCHPTGGHYDDTLANIMQYYFRERGRQVVIRLIGRLDQETSGVVLAAKSQAAANRLNRQKEQGILRKEYLALVEGCPRPLAGTITAPIGRTTQEQCGLRDSIKMQVSLEGQSACTYYEVRKAWEESSLVSLHLETGRTHQIRVHMSSLGCPLLGDTLYRGDETDGAFTRAALHAVRLKFQQPFTKEPICVEAALPADFESYLRKRDRL